MITIQYRLSSVFLYSFMLVVLQINAVLAQPLTVTYAENFDRNVYGWYENKKTPSKLYLQDGKYFMEAAAGGWMIYFIPYLNREKDFAIEASFVQHHGGDNGFGFMWGYDGKDKMNSFTIAGSGYYRIVTSQQGVKDVNDWIKTTVIKPSGQSNKLKIEQRKGELNYYINGKLVTSTKSLTWFGKNLGFVAYGEMKIAVDDFVLSQVPKVKLAAGEIHHAEKENLGAAINTTFDEVSPKISADGRVLYFGRKSYPDNVGGVDDKEDIWYSTHQGDGSWSKAMNMGSNVNTPVTNNLLSVSTDNNTLLFHHTATGFGLMHRTASGWSPMEDLGIFFKNESEFLEGSLSPDGKAIIFAAKLKDNVFYRQDNTERDLYVCVKKADGTWSTPMNTGKILNSPGDEYSPFLAADGQTLYFASDGHPGYGDVDVFMSKRAPGSWTKWSEPVNLGIGINTVGFDAYYTVSASGDYAYMVSNINTRGAADIVRIKLPPQLKPNPVMLISGRVLESTSGKPIQAVIHFHDLATGEEIGEARSNPATGEYHMTLPSGKHYGFRATASGYFSVSENAELGDLIRYEEKTKDLFLVPIQIGESIKLNNVFFVRSSAELKSESFPELNRLVSVMKENPALEIEVQGHTDVVGDASANQLLSEKRVEAVRQYLLSQGIAAVRVTGRGFGGTKPITTSGTEEDRQKNRRVEFKIVKK